MKIGVIGCGSIAQHRHLPEYAAHPDAEIVAVCDIVPERAQTIADQYGTRAYTDYHEMLANEEVEAVSVCTPNYLHAPISIAALHAGKHVLCEKPMALTVEDADKMIEAAKSNQKTLMIGHNQRFVRSHEIARELIESGKIGKIYSFRTTFGHGGPDTWSVDGKHSWFFQQEKAGIGAMADLGVHKADLIRYLLGEEIVEVAAFAGTFAKSATVDDNAVCILKTESGIVGTLTASWSYVSKEDNSTIIYGERAILRLEDHPHYSLIVEYANGEEAHYALGKIQSNEEGGQNTSHVIDHFLKSVINHEEVPVTGSEGKRSLGVILAAMESSQTGKVIKIHP
ncbi:Gfo/Idh/MocA family protein [Heyndrickxia ginsengihumi]|uniref:Dehydrogenase n=1 Tax=Heyndrickxia ginsengihumi TaxID=363870 RepID=A0A0A6VDK1_9BACI|nr:Gfo/Idh/MocA family oxidoreductase [Heyndrickxia ginsengihumi]KHD84619.1 dehydrogenase [Heyndrickxia ginsengihumi]MBE6183370.1 Gfo/Idh/MocA family oxidoreductase [Bacillus sp. (in: firmicutes)]MCM3025091.1 Gfo/Idh/MocA family oxidoreductase [Heyndrickxia ginsengihumi]NEY19121.1 Gfo/Idh/MocA family oxidoreductase [Heyndrickxia ginsengihumi]